MINISIDESEAFDRLSIINVKINNSKGIIRDKNILNFNILRNEIIKNIARYNYDKILDSEEYKDLYDCNNNLFQLINKIKEKPNTIYFDIADNFNLQRFKLKQEIQKKFFNNELKEIKIGYNE